jgi:hypothetical protein
VSTIRIAALENPVNYYFPPRNIRLCTINYEFRLLKGVQPIYKSRLPKITLIKPFFNYLASLKMADFH